MKDRKKDIPNKIVKVRNLDVNLSHRYAVQVRYRKNDDDGGYTDYDWQLEKTFKLLQSAIDYFKHAISKNSYYEWINSHFPDRYTNVEARIISTVQLSKFRPVKSYMKRYHDIVNSKSFKQSYNDKSL